MFRQPTMIEQKRYLVLLASAFLLTACGGASPKAAAKTEKVEKTEKAERDEPPMSPEEARQLRELQEICAKVSCRPETEVTLMVDAERFFQTTVISSPYVYDGVVQILPGEKLYFEADHQADGSLANLRHVEQPVNLERTFEASFFQDTEGREHRGMILRIKSPMDGIVRYKAGINLAGRDGVFKTSTCPLRQGVPVMEMWQDLILFAVLTEFRIVDPESGEASVCD